VSGSAAPGSESLGAGHHRAAADELDDQAELLEHPPAPLHGGQGHPQQGYQAGVGGSAVPAGAVVGEVRQSAGDGDNGIGLDVVGPADVAVLAHRAADLDLDPVGGPPPRRPGAGGSGLGTDAGRDTAGADRSGGEDGSYHADPAESPGLCVSPLPDTGPKADSVLQ
jgi:hypothetical protein